LILEDSFARIDTFRRKLEKDYDLYFFDNVKDSIEALQIMGPFNIVFLDHDLDDKIYVNSNEANTGYQLAKYISENNLKFDQIIIHSMNPVGSDNMKRLLPEAIIAPFPTLF
jgi:hypothetical protein